MTERKSTVSRSMPEDTQGTNVPPSEDHLVLEDARDELNESPVRSVFLPRRIFVNQIDSYHGKKLANIISDQKYDLPTTDSLENSEDGDEERDYSLDSSEKQNSDVKQIPMPRRSEMNYEVVGTVKDKNYTAAESVAMIIDDEENKAAFLSELMKCGVIIYDITLDKSQISQAQWVLEEIAVNLEKMAEERPKAFKRSDEVRYFILISTIMTWALTKPLDASEPDLPFTETDYRKRKAHPNYREHLQCERDVATIVKKLPRLKDKLKTIVLCCGVTYGEEENLLQYLFEMGWKNEPELPIVGNGDNRIPLLHVSNLPTIVMMCLRKWPRLRYLVATEQASMSQKKIVKSISKTLTTGKVKHVEPEEAFLIENMTQQIYDAVTVNLYMEAGYLVDENMTWHTDLPFDENIHRIVEEYKAARNLHPIKIIVIGPPASGKTRLAKKLAEHYDIHYIHVESLIDETIEKLIEETMAAEKSEYHDAPEGSTSQEAEEEDNEENVDVFETLRKELDGIRRNLVENHGRLDDKHLNDIFRKKLMSKECQNQGYVLDGYPKTTSQAKYLFSTSEKEEDDEEGSSLPGINVRIVPDRVIVLEASDEFLLERIINLSEKEVQGTHYTEEQMLRRFREYRERNSGDDTPLDFFHELEIHPIHFAIEDDLCPEMFLTFVGCLKKIGKPRDFRVRPKEIPGRVDPRAETMDVERKALEELDRKREKMTDWTNLLEQARDEEEKQLYIAGEPLRRYLLQHILPTLTEALVQIAELRPDEPVAYLAEYLLRENPEGKLSESDYTERTNAFALAVDELAEDALSIGEFDEKCTKCQEPMPKMCGNAREILVKCGHEDRRVLPEIRTARIPEGIASFGEEMKSDEQETSRE